MRRTVLITGLAVAIIYTAACSTPIGRTLSDGFFVPRHHNSAFTENEEVLITPLDKDDLSVKPDGMDDTLEETYNKVFSQEISDVAKFNSVAPGTPQAMSALSMGAAASPIASFAVAQGAKFVAKEIEKESKRFEASFDAKRSPSGFYTNDNGKITQRIFGVKIERNASYSRKKAGETCYTIYLGFYYSEPNRLMKVAPLAFRTQRAKAKVLKVRCEPAWFWSFLLKQSDNLYSKTQIELQGVYSQDSQEAKTLPLGPTVEVELKKYDLTKAEWKTFKDEGSDAGRWVTAPPVTKSLDGKTFSGNGAYHIKVNVIERDLSNAKKYLKQLSEEVVEQGVSLGKKLGETE